MKVAAYQAPLLPPGDLLRPIPLIREQIRRCEANGVRILCCPEGILGGLADYAPEPTAIALDPQRGDFESTMAQFASSSVAVIIGFTEIDSATGTLFNAAALWDRDSLVGIYRKVYPAINRSVYAPGRDLPVFSVDGLVFGIQICNDANYLEPARVLAAKGAAALFVPTNNGLPPSRGGAELVPVARAIDAARAVENDVSVIRADVAGMAAELECQGSSGITSRDGQLLAAPAAPDDDLIVAEIPVTPRSRRRGWDASRNPTVLEEFIRVIKSPGRDFRAESEC
jgi:predicted amidohydrolase